MTKLEKLTGLANELLDIIETEHYDCDIDSNDCSVLGGSDGGLHNLIQRAITLL